MKALAAIALLLVPLAAAADECDEVPIWRDGRTDGKVCRADAAQRGLVVVDLGNEWTPGALAASEGAGPPYRATYVALAQERFDDAGDDGALARRDRHLELYGIFPTFGVIRARLADTARHACHAAAPPIRPSGVLVEETAQAARKRSARHRAAVRAIQAHLACDGLFAHPAIPGAYTWQTANAVAAFQRGAMILPSGRFDRQTLDAFVLDSRERDFRAALRVLRERVVAATGLLEDGTAGTGIGRVLGRALESPQTWAVRGHVPLANAAPDHISAATEAAALALGWRDADALLASTATNTRYVAVPLPPLPAYHAALDLLIVIDRGDVWLDAAPRRRDIERRPALIVFAKDGPRHVPLARWPTTIGGWQQELVEDKVEKRWKESPAGPRIWRDLLIEPRWLPPASTPDDELVRRADDRFVLARELIGPSYRAAFGLAAFIHVQVAENALVYEGIRTHGTGAVESIATGVSHGCHRLLGMHAMRLASFVLAHHTSVRHGELATFYERVVRHRGEFPVVIGTQGYRIELVPPIPVEVLPGRVRGTSDAANPKRR